MPINEILRFQERSKCTYASPDEENSFLDRVSHSMVQGGRVLRDTIACHQSHSLMTLVLTVFFLMFLI